MLRNRLVHLVAGVAIVGLVGCGADDTDTTVQADTTLVTQPGTETMEVQVPTEDTLLVEERVETEIDRSVDTTRIEGTVRDTVRRP